jgi:GNAT superfamily N-acetyltransferase
LDEVTQRRMTLADLPAADRLRAQAGWNQTAKDWRRLLNWEPEGCFLAETPHGEVVATVTTTVYSGAPRIAWVGMMLVDERVRRRGLGRTMLAQALDWLDRHEVPVVALDATPLGKTLYDSMGFSTVYGLQRREARAPEVRRVHGLRRLSADDVPRLANLDSAAFFGADRLHFLRDLAAAQPNGGWLAERDAGVIEGYVLARPGAHAWQVGPLVARDPATADRLLQAALAPLAGDKVVLDTPDPGSNPDAAALAARYGFEPVRPFIRMSRGAPLPASRSDWCYAIAGPEIG